MASFTDLVKAQRQSGKSVIGSLSAAYNQQNMQKYDPRNALFNRNGMMTALFPGLKGYQAETISGKSPTSLLSQQGGANSPSAMSSIARDARVTARNSMALPSIARNMAQMVRIWGGTPAKYFERAGQREAAYEGKFGGGKKGLSGLGKSAGGGGFNILGMLGGGIGSAIGSIGGIATSILGGVGSMLGGAASGLFGVIGSALGGMGFMGILAAGAIGFVLYQLWKGLDFSKLGGGLGEAFSGIKESLSNLFGDVDKASGGRLGKFIDEVEQTFVSTVNKISAGLQTAINLFKDMGTAVLQDMYGFMINLFQENKGKILGMVAIGAMGAMGGFSTLTGAAVSLAVAAAMAAYGKMTGEKTVEEARSENEALKLELQKTMKDGKQVATYDAQGNVTGYETAGQRASDLQDKIRANEAFIKEKESRTTNTQNVIDRLSSENIKNEYNKNLAERQGATGTSPTRSSNVSAGQVTFNSLSKEQQDKFLQEQFAREGNKKGNLAFDLNNPGAMIFGPLAAKYGAIPNWDRGTLKDKNGKLIPFAQFATLKDGMNAQRELWSTKYGNMPLDDALRKWVAPRNAEEETQLANYKAGLYGKIGVANVGGGATPPTPQLASNTNAPPKAEQKPQSLADTASSLVFDQISALDRMMGGQLMKGSTDLADMLRDVTREFMNNPTFVDSSTNVNNTTSGEQGNAVSASTWDKDVLAAIMDRRMFNSSPMG